LAILVGIDEAGLGPILGPLVVTGVAYRLPASLVESSLWDVLGASCTRALKNRKRRLPITDSKKLHKSREGPGALERTALVTLAASGFHPASFLELLSIVSPSSVDQFRSYRWYGPHDPALPCSDGVGDIPTQSNALRRDLAQHQIEPLGVYSEPLAEGHYNRLVGKTNNKSVVLTGLVLRVVDRVLRAGGEDEIRIHVDRLGGRRLYREPLTRALPNYAFRILEESDRCSAYELTQVKRRVHIEFAKESDDRHFLVALASIYSKYIRELSMHAFNQFWCRRQPGLKPTAGYYQDAQRWLEDARDTIERSGIDRSMLVRMR
jgi:ribonuclease HII